MSLWLCSHLDTYPCPEPGRVAPGAGSHSVDERPHACAQHQTSRHWGKELGRGGKHPPAQTLCYPQPWPRWVAASRASTQHLEGTAGPGDSPKKPPWSQGFPIIPSPEQHEEQQRLLVLWGFQPVGAAPASKKGWVLSWFLLLFLFLSPGNPFLLNLAFWLLPGRLVSVEGLPSGGGEPSTLGSSPSEQTGSDMPFGGACGVIAQPAARRARVMGDSIS